MKSSTTRWLLLLALGVFAFIMFFERRQPGARTRDTTGLRLLPALDVKRVTALDVIRGTNLLLSVEAREGRWHFTAPLDYPARPEGIERLLAALADAAVAARIEAADVLRQTNGLAGFGFEPPAVTLTLRMGTERTTIRLGHRTVIGGQLYAQCVGRDGLDVVDARLLEAFPEDAYAWRDTALLDLRRLAFDRIEARPLTTGGFELVRADNPPSWRMTKPLNTPGDGRKLEFLTRQMDLLRTVRFVADRPGASLDAYGLQPPQRELVFARGTNELAVLQIGTSPTNEPGLVYLRSLARSNVVLVSRETLAPWLDSFRHFADRRLMVFAEEAADRIEAQTAEPFTLQRLAGGAWQVVQPFTAPADPELVGAYLRDLAELEFIEFAREVVADFAPFGLDPPLLRYTVRGAVTNAPGGGVLARVDYGRPEGHRVYARRAAESSVLVALEPVRLPRAAFQVRDRQIWNVSTNDLVAVVVEQQGRSRRLVREGPLRWSVAAGVPGSVSSFTLEEAAFRLGRLRAERWVARGEDEFARYGITTSDHQITLEQRRGDQVVPHRLRLGARAPSGRPYAAVTLEGETGPVIFECPPAIADLVMSEFSLPPAAAAQP